MIIAVVVLESMGFRSQVNASAARSRTHGAYNIPFSRARPPSDVLLFHQRCSRKSTEHVASETGRSGVSESATYEAGSANR